MNWKTKQILILLGFIVYNAIVVGLLPMFIGFGPFGGFEKEEILTKFMFYIGPAALFLIGISAIVIASLIIFKEKDKEVSPLLIHDLDRGIFSFKFFKVMRNFIIFIFTFIFLFSIMGMLSVRTQTFFSEIPKLEQQFTKTADVFFSIYPASPSENLGLIFFIFLSLFILGLYFKKRSINYKYFLIFAILIVLLVSIVYGVTNHYLRYSGSDIDMIFVALFWAIMGLWIIITGSVFPSYIMHDMNNLFKKLGELFASDTITYITIGVLFLMFIIFISYILFMRGKRKTKENE